MSEDVYRGGKVVALAALGREFRSVPERDEPFFSVLEHDRVGLLRIAVARFPVRGEPLSLLLREAAPVLTLRVVCANAEEGHLDRGVARAVAALGCVEQCEVQLEGHVVDIALEFGYTHWLVVFDADVYLPEEQQSRFFVHAQELFEMRVREGLPPPCLDAGSREAA